jgi:uncharacterized protein (TIGR00661 family)
MAMNSITIAYFISPHGFGHAARASAVMEAIHARLPEVRFALFTRAPRWFFQTSLSFDFDYYELESDIGLVQNTPLTEDLPATIARLEGHLPFAPERLKPAVEQMTALGCALAICDISPLGIVAANAAHIPSILIENFTWDWIYAGYQETEPRFSHFIPLLAQAFHSARAHIQTEPRCEPATMPDLLSNPVGRKPRRSRADIRRSLNIPDGAQAVLISMGGFELQYRFLDRLAQYPSVYFIVPGGSERIHMEKHLCLLPHHSEYYHPDLIHACDAVISKAGYSTIAEAYYAGIPFGYVSRSQFRESPLLSAFIQAKMQGIEIDNALFQTGAWIDLLPNLLSLPRIRRNEANGADQIADWIVAHFFHPA